VLTTARGAEYSVSQRAEHIWESVSSATTRSRPIINTRDEPHADPERYRRLHVIVGDSNMSETTTLLKVGSAELVLRLIEAGVPMRDLALDNPIRAIRDMSRDRTGQVQVSLSNGRRISALELQTEYYEKVAEFVTRESLRTPTVDRVLDLWERTLRAVGEDKLELIDTEIDWAIKLKLLERYSAKHQLSLADPRIAGADAACSPSSSPGERRRGSPPSRPCSGPSRSPRRPPGPSCAATSSAPPRSAAATTRSTGCTSSSTTRPSARCSARTRSSPPTSGWTV
jgi:proteasome accessory factor A